MLDIHREKKDPEILVFWKDGWVRSEFGKNGRYASEKIFAIGR